MLKNYKTYICAALMVIVAGLHAKGYITDATFKLLEVIFAGGGLAALRLAVSGK